MISHYQLRAMTASDISAIDNQFLKQHWGSRHEVLTDYFKQQQTGQRWVFIAETAGEVAGYVTLLPSALHGPFVNRYPEIADFNVFEAFQRQGIGNRLLQQAENTAKSFSDIVTLGVGLHPGYGPAQRLYCKRGYLPDGSGVWYHNRRLAMDEPCRNDDDLVLYLAKRLR